MIKSGRDIIFASKLIREGKLVAFPTETVYGLGANGLDAKAVARIFEVKRRPSFDPLILHIAAVDDLNRVFAQPISPLITLLTAKYWPGPLTIVAPRHKNIPDIVTAGLPTVAVRMPSHPVALKLIRLSTVPIAAPSANLFGRLSPTAPQHVKEQLTSVDYLLEGGRTDIGIESTIVSVSSDAVTVIRPGIITEAQIAADFPHIKVVPAHNAQAINAPGQLKSHYSPSKPLYLIDRLPAELSARTGLIIFNPASLPAGINCRVIQLSPNGNLLEAASNLFAALHDFENDPSIDAVYAMKVDGKGIGTAIMDRLNKAAYRFSEELETEL